MSRQVDVRALVSHIIKGDGADKCRICLADTAEGQVYLGDTVMMDGDKPVTLAELLESISGVEISEEIYYPRGVCIQCTNSAVAAHEFSILANNSIKLWSNAVHSLGTLPDSVFTTNTKSVCAIMTQDLSLQVIKDTATGDSKTVLNRLQMRFGRKRPDVSIKRHRVPRTGPQCRCPDCNKAFLSPYYLNVHLKNSGQKEACIICGDVTIRGAQMRDHLQSCHDETFVMCKECPSLFNSAEDLKCHSERAHSPAALTCLECGRTFPRKGSFELHSQMHAVRTCRSCGTQFTNRACYREHRSNCEPEAKPVTNSVPRSRRSNIRDPATYTCNYCGKTYHSRPQLKNHIIWIHMNVRPHECEWCKKRFYTAARLAEHTVVHTRIRNFACDICGAKLVSKMAAVYHRRRHTGEKPYECEDCGERFISSSRRSEHAKRRHGKGTRYQCDLCPANFVRTSELRKHSDKAHKQFQIIDELVV